MTPPEHSSGGAFLTVRFEPSMDAWTFTGAEAGPAGAVSVVLDDVRLSVDAADPARIVEIAVRAQPPHRATASACHLTGVLLGTAAADFLATAEPPLAGVRIEISGDTAIRASAAALAVALAALARRPPAHRLRGLDVVLHAHRIGPASSAADVRRAAWAVWPATVALARACAGYPAMLAAAPGRALGELRSRLLVLLHLVEQDDPSVVSGAAYRLVAELAERAATARPEVLAHLDLDAELAELEFDDYPILDLDIDRERVFKSSTAVARPLRWKGHVEDFASRLGDELRLLHPGLISASGQLPGEVTVTVPVALGTGSADLHDIRVRAVTDTGHLLGEGRLAVRSDPGSLPVGIARLMLPQAADGRPYARVVIDLAHRVVAAPNTTDLERLDRSRAIRSGQEAVAHATAGDHRTSARLWRQCADQFDAIDEHELRDRAHEQAEQAKQAAAAAVDRADAEWLTALLAVWSRWALTELDRIRAAIEPGPDEGPLDELRELVARLAGWNDPSVELAQACRELGRALRGVRQHADEADCQLRAALRIFYELGDDVEALACLRELGTDPAQG